MNDIKISVVVPIFKIEKYIKRCINSIINQSYSNLEIVLVNDGSPDNCGDICDEYKEMDNRIKVIHKQNEGLGFARNTGLLNATGEYICFLDGDDYIEQGLFDAINQKIKDQKYDVIIFGHKVISPDSKIALEKIISTTYTEYQGEYVQNVFLADLIADNPRKSEHTGLIMSSCTCCYRKSVFIDNNIKFYSEKQIISEDVYTLLDLYSYIKSVAIISDAYYCYCENENSLTRTYRPDRFDKIVYFFKKSEEMCVNKKYNNEIKLRIISPFLSFILACLKMEAKAMKRNGFWKTYYKFKEICSNQILQDAIKVYPKNSFSKGRKLLHWFIYKKVALGVLLLCLLKNDNY